MSWFAFVDALTLRSSLFRHHLFWCGLLCFRTAGCEICALSDAVIRCASPARRDVIYNLTVTVTGQSSAPAVYSYEEIMHKPVVANIAPLSGPTTVRVLLMYQCPTTMVSF